jgi:hypothetical protein
MKKVVVISLMSLLFLATFAQRPSKSRSTEVDDNDRNKSEMTTDRSNENNSRSVEMKSDRSDNVDNNRTNNTNNSISRPDDGNNNRTNTANKSDDHLENANNNRTYTPGNNNPGDDIRNESNDHINRSINSRTYEVERRNYSTPDRHRSHHEVYPVNRPRPVEYRRIHHPYHAPVDVHVYWTPRIYHEYMMIYPEYHYWYYPNGYMIRTISAYDAMYYIGEVANVYGRVYETWYSRETDEYFLYFGAGYPYQDFSVVIPGKKARQFSRRPEIFFEGRYIWVTGLISLNQGQPEMIVMKKHQIHLY